MSALLIWGMIIATGVLLSVFIGLFGFYRMGVQIGRMAERELVVEKLCQWAEACVDSHDCGLLVRAAKKIRAAKANLDG